MTGPHRSLTILSCALMGFGLPAAVAIAERPANRREFAAIDRYLAPTERSLHMRLDWVKISTRGPFALAYLSGAGSISANVLRGAGVHWRYFATISDEGLPCGTVPGSVVADLQLERYNAGPKPCSPR